MKTYSEAYSQGSSGAPLELYSEGLQQILRQQIQSCFNTRLERLMVDLQTAYSEGIQKQPIREAIR